MIVLRLIGSGVKVRNACKKDQTQEIKDLRGIMVKCVSKYRPTKCYLKFQGTIGVTVYIAVGIASGVSGRKMPISFYFPGH